MNNSSKISIGAIADYDVIKMAATSKLKGGGRRVEVEKEKELKKGTTPHCPNKNKISNIYKYTKINNTK